MKIGAYLKNYQKEEWDYLDKHLLINSPLYGILRYNDAVNYHRLEMKHKLNEINLYFDKSTNSSILGLYAFPYSITTLSFISEIPLFLFSKNNIYVIPKIITKNSIIIKPIKTFFFIFITFV